MKGTGQKRGSAGRPSGKGARGHIAGLILVLFGVAFVAGGLYFGFIFLTKLTDIVGAISQTYLELPINIGGKKDPATGPDWSAKERVNVLLLGIDQRPSEAGEPTRTDTMMVATLDPSTETAGLLSIPRDLWVPIHLKNGQTIEDRINTPNVYGDIYKYPGGGIALTRATVEELLNIKIHYYALINFAGFEKVVDTLGGITINLDKPLVDNEYPTNDYGTMKIYIPAGVQQLNGQKALWYVRSRHADNDFERNKRQQQALLAIRNKALALDVVPKIPELWKQFRDLIKTDMGPPEMMALARLGKDIGQDKITSRSIDVNSAAPGYTSGGADVLFPDRAKIAQIAQEVFFDSRLAKEAATVEVLNGTSTPGLAAKTSALLQRQGFKQVTYGSADDGETHKVTAVYSYAGKSYSAKMIAGLLNVSSKIVDQKANDDAVDIRVILGTDANIPDK